MNQNLINRVLVFSSSRCIVIDFLVLGPRVQLVLIIVRQPDSCYSSPCALTLRGPIFFGVRRIICPTMALQHLPRPSTGKGTSTAESNDITDQYAFTRPSADPNHFSHGGSLLVRGCCCVDISDTHHQRRVFSLHRAACVLQTA